MIDLPAYHPTLPFLRQIIGHPGVKPTEKTAVLLLLFSPHLHDMITIPGQSVHRIGLIPYICIFPDSKDKDILVYSGMSLGGSVSCAEKASHIAKDFAA
jgi:hypothetical protein